jgi:hypothetical protein
MRQGHPDHLQGWPEWQARSAAPARACSLGGTVTRLYEGRLPKKMRLPTESRRRLLEQERTFPEVGKRTLIFWNSGWKSIKNEPRRVGSASPRARLRQCPTGCWRSRRAAGTSADARRCSRLSAFLGGHQRPLGLRWQTTKRKMRLPTMCRSWLRRPGRAISEIDKRTVIF